MPCEQPVSTSHCHAFSVIAGQILSKGKPQECALRFLFVSHLVTAMRKGANIKKRGYNVKDRQENKALFGGSGLSDLVARSKFLKQQIRIQ